VPTRRTAPRVARRPPGRSLGRLFGPDDVLAAATRDEPDQHAGRGYERGVADAPAGRVEQLQGLVDGVVVVYDMSPLLSSQA
jgi:hypothetical protein